MFSVRGDGPPVRKVSLRLFDVVIHDVRCRKLAVLLLLGPGVIHIFEIVGKAYRPRAGVVSNVYPGDKPDLGF